MKGKQGFLLGVGGEEGVTSELKTPSCHSQARVM